MKMAAVMMAGVLALAHVSVAQAESTPAPAAAAEQKTVVLKVEGMTCGGCSSSVNKKLGATPGVVSCKADHTAGTATVTYTAGKVAEADLVAAINKLGFKAAAPAAP
jgi:copper chaperone CopZ